MNTEIITSLQNPQVKKWRLLNKSHAERVSQGLFCAEGEHMAQEAVQTGKAAVLLISEKYTDKFAFLTGCAHVPVHYLADHVFASLCDAKTPQGIIALCPYLESTALSALGSRVVCLNAVQDPGNVGTILRTMDAAGFTGLLFDEKTADPFSPKALRASMGSIFRLPVVRTSDLSHALDQLQQQDFEILAGDLSGAPFFDPRERKENTCIIIGNEGAGISPKIKEKATLRLKLPMMGGAESLNAAVAAAIMMYDDLRHRLTNP
ncbi:MAG: RNA methyltransferase [Clostridia bacterium]|nr:RNA methyltransferase [Clostridia bacterium]